MACAVTATAATAAAGTNAAAAACAMAGSVTAAAAFFCTCRHMLHYMLHNLLMLYLAVRQSNRFFLHDILHLLLAIVGSISDSFIATAASAGIKEHHGVSIRSRRLHSKNA